MSHQPEGHGDTLAPSMNVRTAGALGQPIYYSAPPPPRPEDMLPEREASLFDFIAVLKKRIGLIMSVAFLFFFSAAVYCLVAPRMYTASAGVEIRGYVPLLKGAEVESLFGIDSRKLEYQKTTIAKLSRLSLADRVLTRDNLAAEMGEYFDKKAGFANRLKTLVGMKEKTAPLSPETPGKIPSSFLEEGEEDFADDHYKNPPSLLKKYVSLVGITPVRETSIVEVTVTTSDPKLSQKLANAHVKTFIEYLAWERKKSISGNVRQLQAQADDLKKKIDDAQKNVSGYAAQNQLTVLPQQDDESLIVRQISDLTRVLVEATSKRIKSESMLRQVEMEADASALDDETIRDMKQALKTAEAEYADMGEKVTPAYPAMMQLRAKIGSLRDNIKKERALRLRTLKTQFESDLQSETKLSAQIEQLKGSANIVSQKLVAYNVLLKELQALQELYQLVLKQLKETQVGAASSGSNISISDFAILPTLKSAPMTKLILILGLVLGVAGGIGIALVLEFLDTTIKTGDDVQEALGLPALGSLPSFTEGDEEQRTSRIVPSKVKRLFSSDRRDDQPDPLPELGDSAYEMGSNVPANRDRAHDFVTITSPHGVVSEALRTIRASILLSSIDNPARAVMVTSANAGEGKTTLASNIAITLAQASRKTILIDADIRKARVNELFSLSEDAPGLVDFLAGEVSLGDVIQKDLVKNLDVIPAGAMAPSPSELLGSKKMGQLVQQLMEVYDYVILDSPPVLPVADSLMLSRVVDGVLMVVRSQSTPRESAQEAHRRLRHVNARMLGVVLNDVSRADSSTAAYTSRDAYVMDNKSQRRRVVGG